MLDPRIFNPDEGISYSSIKGDRLDDAFQKTQETAIELGMPVPMIFDDIRVKVKPDSTFEDVRREIADETRYRASVMNDPTRGGGSVNIADLDRIKEKQWEEFVGRRDDSRGANDINKSNETRSR